MEITGCLHWSKMCSLLLISLFKLFFNGKSVTSPCFHKKKTGYMVFMDLIDSIFLSLFHQHKYCSIAPPCRFVTASALKGTALIHHCSLCFVKLIHSG